MSHRIIYDMPPDEYRATPGISKSGLDKIAISPAHYQASLTATRTETPALRLGTLIHTALLEPGRLDYVVKPADMSFATKEGKAWKAENEGCEILSQADDDTITGIQRSVQAHKAARQLLTRGKAEVSLFATDSTATTRKARPDFMPDGTNIIADIKTCERADIGSFQKSILRYRYHVQAAYYLDMAERCGLERDAFVFIAVEKEPPYAVAVYQLDIASIELGREQYERDLAVYRQCVKSGVWPAYGDDIQPISVPAWALTDHE